MSAHSDFRYHIICTEKNYRGYEVSSSIHYTQIRVFLWGCVLEKTNDKEAIPSVKQSFPMTLRHLHRQSPFNETEHSGENAMTLWMDVSTVRCRDRPWLGWSSEEYWMICTRIIPRLYILTNILSFNMKNKESLWLQ